jgi:hypothetical protein
MDWKSLAGYTNKSIEKSCAVIEKDEKNIPGAVAIKYFPMAIEGPKVPWYGMPTATGISIS